MLLRWNEERVLYIPLVRVYSATEFAKMSDNEKQVAIAPIGAITLLPGVNEVLDSEWEIAKPHCQRLLKMKANDLKNKDKIALETLSFKVGVATLTSFFKLPQSTARKLLAETFNPRTLQYWEQFETRESVRVDLKKRMDEIGVDPLTAADLADEAIQITEDPSNRTKAG